MVKKKPSILATMTPEEWPAFWEKEKRRIAIRVARQQRREWAERRARQDQPKQETEKGVE